MCMYNGALCIECAQHCYHDTCIFIGPQISPTCLILSDYGNCIVCDLGSITPMWMYNGALYIECVHHRYHATCILIGQQISPICQISIMAS